MFVQRTLIKEQGGDMQAYVSPLIFFFISRIFFFCIFLNKQATYYLQTNGKKSWKKLYKLHYNTKTNTNLQ